MSPFTLLTTISVLMGLIALPGINGECCVNSRTFRCCGLTKSDCNFFCCGCEGGCGEGCAFDIGLALGTAAGYAGQGLETIGGGFQYIKNQTHAGKRESEEPEPTRLTRRRRRSVPSQSATKYGNTVRAFETVDLNHDRVIDYDEGLAFLQNTKVSKRSPGKRLVKREDLIDFNEQFQQLDRNNDGVIEPHEFDSSLA